MMIEKTRERFERLGYDVEISPSVALLAAKECDLKSGARGLRRAVRRLTEDVFAAEILTGGAEKGEKHRIDVKEESTVVLKKSSR
jgi:ATP-dependent Clp protease ATP-binding subunit ClpA